MSNTAFNLKLAETIADMYGDGKLFAEEYRLAREHHDISDSIEIALEKQNLSEIFKTTGGYYVHAVR